MTALDLLERQLLAEIDAADQPIAARAHRETVDAIGRIRQRLELDPNLASMAAILIPDLMKRATCSDYDQETRQVLGNSAGLLSRLAGFYELDPTPSTDRPPPAPERQEAGQATTRDLLLEVLDRGHPLDDGAIRIDSRFSPQWATAAAAALEREAPAPAFSIDIDAARRAGALAFAADMRRRIEDLQSVCLHSIDDALDAVEDLAGLLEEGKR